MPAKGAKCHQLQAPRRAVAERRAAERASLERRSPAPTATAAARACRRSSGVSLRRAPRRARSRWSGPSGCGKTTLLELICGLQAPDAGPCACAPAVLMPQRDLLLPWLERARQRGARAADRAGVARAPSARDRAAALFAELGLDGLRARAPARALGRDAPARRVPAHAALGQAGAVPGRAVRRARRDHARARCRSGWPRRSRASRARSCS